MYKEISQELLDFLQKSPTAFHAVENIRNELLENGFMKCNDMVLQKYLQIVLKENKNLRIEQVFNSNNSFRR